MLFKYTEFPELAQRLAGVEIRNPYERGKVIDLTQFWVMEVRTSDNGRLSCDILYPQDVMGQGMSFFDETVQIWFHFQPLVAVAFPERSKTMNDVNPQAIASANANTKADTKTVRTAKKVLLHGPQGALDTNFAQVSSDRNRRKAELAQKGCKFA